MDVRLKILVKESFGYIHLFRWEEKTIEWNKLYSLINNSYCLYPDVSWETHPSLLARVVVYMLTYMYICIVTVKQNRKRSTFVTLPSYLLLRASSFFFFF